MVKKDELLAFYSREFRNAEQAYLGSLASLERLKGSHDQEDPARSSDASLRINEEQLRSLGMGEPQIKELAKTRQITRDITLTSPIDGIVLSREVSPGQRFERALSFTASPICVRSGSLPISLQETRGFSLRVHE